MTKAMQDAQLSKEQFVEKEDMLDKFPEANDITWNASGVSTVLVRNNCLKYFNCTIDNFV